MIKEIIKRLQKINWDFSDFVSRKYPFDLNSIPWYPATFISPIPRLLVASLSKPGDIVLDPFGGKGTTAIETALQNRIPLYCDLNSFIASDTEGLFASIEYVIKGRNEIENEVKALKERNITDEEAEIIRRLYGIDIEIYKWFHKDSANTLVGIVELINSHRTVELDTIGLIHRLAFSSILKSASSQTGHYTYVTDNCKPKKLIKRDALQLYVDKVVQIIAAAKEFVFQYQLSFPNGDLKSILNKRQIVTGNAKDLSWVSDNSVDLVVTSPPYLCSQDYIKTMRLMNMFFPDQKTFSMDVKEEIGARATRYGKQEVVVPRFYSDMEVVITNINRVLKKNGVFALVVGQGKSRITTGYDIIKDLTELIERKNLKLIFQKERHIGSRVIQVGGVDKESVLIFYKQEND